jgi:hypothetical protein
MAEWLSTDLFHGSITTPSRMGQHTNADLGPVEAAFGNRANDVKEPDQKKQRDESQAEQEFRDKQFPHEIELEHKGHG